MNRAEGVGLRSSAFTFHNFALSNFAFLIAASIIFPGSSRSMAQTASTAAGKTAGVSPSQTPQGQNERSTYRQTLLTSSAQISKNSSPNAPVAPLDTILLGQGSCCANLEVRVAGEGNNTFQRFLNRGLVGTLDYTQLLQPAGNTPNSPLGPFTQPYLVTSRNITFRVPGYVAWTDFDQMNDNALKFSFGSPTTIIVQALQLNSNHTPIRDPNDQTGYKWTNISQSVSSDPAFIQSLGAVRSFSSNSPYWASINAYFLNGVFVDTDPTKPIPGSAYRLLALGGNGGDGPTVTAASKYTVDLPSTLPDITNIVRFSIVMHLPGLRDAQFYSGAIALIVTPTALVQAKALPVAIIYQPPGDKSIVDYSNSQSSVTGFSIAQGTVNQAHWSNSVSHKTDSSVEMGFSVPVPVIGSVGFKMNMEQSSSWDSKVTGSNSANDSSTNSFKLTYQMSRDWKLAGNPAGGQSYSAPYWNDVFVLAPHPQFAFWNFLPASGEVTMHGGILVDMLGVNMQGAKFVNVRALDACANNTDVGIPLYSGSSENTEYLQQKDCQDLLRLDPFYVNGQNYDVSSFATYQAPINLSVPNFSDSITLGTSTTTETDVNTITGVGVGIDVSQGQTSKVGLSGKLGDFGISGETSTTDSYSTGHGSDLNLTYTNAASRVATLATSSTRTISDDGNGSQLPIIGQAYIDNRFGTWMFQSETPHTCFSDGKGAGCSTPCAGTACKPPCKSSSGEYVCPAVASTTGSWAAGKPAQAKCGDAIVISGFGMTEVTGVRFVPENGTDVRYDSPSILVQSDDVVTATLNASGNGTYSVQLTTFGSSGKVIAGRLTVSGGCPAR